MDTDHQPQNIGPAIVPPGSAVGGSIRAGHETTDVSVRGLFIFGGSLLAAIGITLVGVAVLFLGFNLMNQYLDGRRARVEPGAASLVHRAPDYQGPLLQVDPEEDLRWMKDHNAAELGRYGWVDRPAGVVSLPVERAIELVAERGLPPVSPGKTLEELQRQRADPQVYGQSLRP